MHRLASTAGDEGHKQPAFLSWHRAMLLHVERELQKIDPSVALHYWDWDAAGAECVLRELHGSGGHDRSDSSVSPSRSSAASNPLNGWNTDLPFSGGELRRSGSDHTLLPERA